MSHFAGPNGRRVHLFINNPFDSGYEDATGLSPFYDVLTAPYDSDYSVPHNRKSVDDGDCAVIYRVEPNASKRVPGKIVAVECITSSPWLNRAGEGRISWIIQLLPPEAWVRSADMQASGFWNGKVPFSRNGQVANPVELDKNQWSWMAAQLPTAAVELLEEHAG